MKFEQYEEADILDKLVNEAVASKKRLEPGLLRLQILHCQQHKSSHLHHPAKLQKPITFSAVINITVLENFAFSSKFINFLYAKPPDPGLTMLKINLCQNALA